MIDLNRFSTDNTLELWFRAKIPDTHCALTLGPCEFSKEASFYSIKQDKNFAIVGLKSLQEKENLDFFLKRGCAYLCSIQNIVAKQESPQDSIDYTLDSIDFSQDSIDSTQDSIEFSRDSIDSTQDLIDFTQYAYQDFTQELYQEFQLRISFFYGDMILLNELKVLYSPKAAYARWIKNLPEDLELKINGRSYLLFKQTEGDPQHFTFLGKNYLLDIVLISNMSVDPRSDAAPDCLLCQVKSVRINNQRDFRAIRLAEGSISFIDKNDEAFLQQYAVSKLKELGQAQESYLVAWDEYAEWEGKLLLKRIREVGYLHYVKHDVLGSHRRLFLEPASNTALQKGDCVSISARKPDFISDLELSWKDFINQQEKRYRDKRQGQEEESKDKDVLGMVLEIHEHELIIDCPYAPPKEGFVTLAFTGDLAQLERRLKARESIRSGECANPILGVIIEPEAQIPLFKPASKDHIDPLTPEVKSKVFKNNPVTAMQLKAIEVALNTPDIALIQGPPGTGKTTVILAIIERLNQILDPATSRGSILVSAFQHDAVENLLERLNLNSFSTFKFGSNKNNVANLQSKMLDEWRKKQLKLLQARYPNLNAFLQSNQFQQTSLSYKALPSLEQEESLLQAMMQLDDSLLSSDLRSRINACMDEFLAEKHHKNTSETEHLLHFAYALRTDEESYADDGVSTATAVLVSLEHLLTPEDKALLSDYSIPKDKEYFTKIKRLRNRLIECLKPEVSQSTPKPKQKVLDLIQDLEDSIKQKNTRKLESIISDFVFELENNPNAVQVAIEDTSCVFAATIQQSEGKDIIKAKKRFDKVGPNNLRDLSYDTIIVDEAARASPMDLLIPMAKAKKRIILVGDHKQLPHIIDEEIVKRLETDQEQKDLYAKSMFEHLRERLNQLTAQDGVERVVMLDTQYRMHPLLGKFVSDAFYEGQVNSVLPEQNFQHQLPYTDGKAALWLDVPLRLGAEEHKGTSRIRRIEASLIVKQLIIWMRDAQTKNLSFGVISFYKAQALEIEQEAKRAGLLVKDINGAWVVASQYAGEGVTERLRINTVDAFQGMEFDVVILSMVRSSFIEPGFSPAKLYGHLLSKQRLCVAVSRQKRVLEIVGDCGMLNTPQAQKGIPEILAFYNLCCQYGKVFNSGL